jgi:CysZ protein
MSVQYVDYAADNHQLSFEEMRRRLLQKKYSSMGLGGMVMLASIVPVFNIIAMPAAVTAGTLFWARELKYPPALKTTADS